MNKWIENHPIEYRALILLNNYKKKDKLYGRGQGDLTRDWIIEHILSQPCAHCGKRGWDVIGCNRLDDSKPHTKDNVEPCCKECNDRIHTEGQSIQVDQIDMTGEVIAVYHSASEAARDNGFDQGAISKCCMGVRNKHKGYYWKYVSN